MRGVQLQQLVIKLKQMVGQSSNPSAGIDDLDMLKEALRETQEYFYDEYDWHFLRVEASKDLAAGQRYYDFPTEINPDKIEKVVSYWSGQPYPIERGIDFNEYAQYDSDADERVDPVRRWDVRWTGSAMQLEAWPIPAGNDQSLKFIGTRPLRAFVQNTDVCDLDDRLIVLFAAADILAEKDSKKAQRVAARAGQRLATLRQQSKVGSGMIVYGGGAMPRTKRDHVVIRVR